MLKGRYNKLYGMLMMKYIDMSCMMGVMSYESYLEKLEDVVVLLGGSDGLYGGDDGYWYSMDLARGYK